MARIPKNNITTPFLHIMIQGNNKNLIFENTKDKDKYLKILNETKNEIPTIILAYCIMGNHTHLLFYDKNLDNIIKFMHKSNLLYAKYYNFKYNRVGYVFRDRYKVQPIMSENHLLTCINYIHNNPVKAGMCKMPREYRYSSYNTNVFMGNSQLEKNIKKYIEERKNYPIDNDFSLMENDKDDKEVICKEYVERFLLNNNFTLEDLKNDKDKLKILITYLKDNYSISYRTIEKNTKISREKLRTIYVESKESRGYCAGKKI